MAGFRENVGVLRWIVENRLVKAVLAEGLVGFHIKMIWIKRARFQWGGLG